MLGARMQGLVARLTNGRFRREKMPDARRIIVHAGFPKTGSTAIQNALFLQRGRILREFGVLYPGFAVTHTKPVHAMFSKAGISDPRFGAMTQAGFDAYAASARDAFEAELDRNDWSVAVISGEGIQYLDAAQWKRLVTWLQRWSDCVEVEFSIRDPLDFARSSVQQILKSGRRIEDVYGLPLVQNIRDTMARAASSGVVTRGWSFDAAARSSDGLIREFVRHLRLPDALGDLLATVRVPRNESLSAPAVAALAQRNAVLERPVAIDADELKRLLAIKGDTFVLPPEVRDTVRLRSADDAAWIAENFCGMSLPVPAPSGT